MPEIDYSALQSYLEGNVPSRHPVLTEMEARAKETGFPILGPASCQFCFVLARLIGAQNVYELGSGYGYSTAWFAQAVEANGGGTVHHTVWDQGLSDDAKGYLSRLGLQRTEIHFTMGEAVAALTETPGPFDIVFNDIDKKAYPDTVSVAHEKLRPGGLFITDNVVWSGRVIAPEQDDETTAAIIEFTKAVCQSKSWDASIVPIRDGLLVARKR